MMDKTRPVAPLALTLSCTHSQDRTFAVTLFWNGHPRASHTVSVSAWHAVHRLVDGFRQLLKGEETGIRPGSGLAGGRDSADQVATGSQLLLQSIGVELFHLWLAPFWPELDQPWRARRPMVLTVLSRSPEVLNLPWELLQWPDGSVLGLDKRVVLRRRPGDCDEPPETSGDALLSAPTRMLLVSSAPAGYHGTDVRDLARMVPSVPDRHFPLFVGVMHGATRLTLRQRLQRDRPHLLCLTGPTLISGEDGFFGLEDETGQADVCAAAELAREVLAGSGVTMVVVAGREPDRPPPVAAVGALCQGLVTHGLDWALACPGLLTAPFSGAFFRAFVHNLRTGATLDQAVRRGRRAIQPACEQANHPVWALPALYARTHGSLFFNHCSTTPPVRAVNPSIVAYPLAGLTDGLVVAHDPVREEIQRLLPDLQTGAVQTLLLNGPSGGGRTRLATGLAQSLRQHGWTPLALTATPFQPLSSGRLLAAFATALAQQDLHDEAQIVSTPHIGIEERLGVVAAVMHRKWACVLVLDGLESALEPATGHFLEPAMAAFWTELASQSGGLSRTVITSSLLPVLEGEAVPSGSCRQEIVLPGREWPASHQVEQWSAVVRAMDGVTLAQVTAMTIFHHPVPVAGYCTVTQLDPAQQEALLHRLEQEGLAHGQALPSGDPLWYLHPWLRSTLDARKNRARLGRQHAWAGAYLWSMADRQQQEALGLGWLDLALEAVGHDGLCGSGRHHALFAQVLQRAAPVSDFFSRHGLHWEQERLNRALLAIREHPRPLYLTAMSLLKRGRPEEAKPLLERVLTFGDALFPRENALALFDLATLAMPTQPDDAREKLLQALSINQRVGDRSGQAVCHAHLGFWGLQQADMAVAQTHLDAALALCRDLDDQAGVANLLPWTGELHWRVGNVVAARRHFQEALQRLPDGDHAEVEAQLHHRLAIMSLGEENFDQALRGFLRSLEIKRATEDQRGEAVAFFQLGRLAKARGDELASLRLLGLCQRLGQALGDADARQTLALFHELALTALRLNKASAQTILDEVWAEYCQDRGQSLLARLFGTTS
ncbi:MAG: tetratricopeptide repeat protein [Magnetococcus sp. DMHC-8]